MLPKPDNLSHVHARCLPYGGFSALHCIKKGCINIWDHVLIFSALGSIGTMSIQFAKKAGAIVSHVCSSKKYELAKALEVRTKK